MSDAIERGNRALQILDDDLFLEAWEGLERGAIARLAACDVTDTKTLQTLTMGLQTVRAVRRQFETWVAQGKEAAERQIRAEMQPSMLSRFRRQL